MKQKIAGVWIEEEDVPKWENFKSVVLAKHGKLHGVLGDEMVRAIELYLEHEKGNNNIQEHTRKDVKSRIGQIMRNMHADGYELETTRKIVERYIKETGIKDKRTISKYFKILIDYGLLKHKVGAVYRINHKG